MAVPKGYAGNVAIIDLTNQKAQIVPTDEFWKEYDIDPRLWLGGDGFITKILWKDIPKAIDPIGPENEVIIATVPGRLRPPLRQDGPCWVVSALRPVAFLPAHSGGFSRPLSSSPDLIS